MPSTIDGCRGCRNRQKLRQDQETASSDATARKLFRDDRAVFECGWARGKKRKPREFSRGFRDLHRRSNISVVVVNNDSAVVRNHIDRVLAIVVSRLVAVAGHANIWATAGGDADFNVHARTNRAAAAIAWGAGVWNLNDDWNGARGDVASLTILHAGEHFWIRNCHDRQLSDRATVLNFR